MSPTSDAIAKIQALQLPGESDQDQTLVFLQGIKDTLEECPGHSKVHIDTDIVSYKDAPQWTHWMKKTNNDPYYCLTTCNEAVHKHQVSGVINYWICYSYSTLNFEGSATGHNMVARGASETELADAKAIYNAGGGIWHAVVVKYNAKKVRRPHPLLKACTHTIHHNRSTSMIHNFPDKQKNKPVAASHKCRTSN